MELSELWNVNYRFLVRSNVITTPCEETTDLNPKTVPVVGSLQGVKSHEQKTEKGLKNGKETIRISCSCKKRLIKKTLLLTKELPAVRVEWANLPSGHNEMPALVYQMKHDFRRLLSTVFTVAKKTYDNVVDAVNERFMKNS